MVHSFRNGIIKDKNLHALREDGLIESIKQKIVSTMTLSLSGMNWM